MRQIKEYFTLEEVKDLPLFVQKQVTRPEKHNSQVEKIKDMLEKGYKQVEIARKLGISRQAVSEFIKNHHIKVKKIMNGRNIHEKLDIAIKAMTLARDTAYSSAQDCPKCAFIDEKLTEALKKIKN